MSGKYHIRSFLTVTSFMESAANYTNFTKLGHADERAIEVEATEQM
jgi:hypothetical protein